jgi:hypothetical protein
MARKIRWLRPHLLYESTFRTVDRQFLFKPNHHPQNPLLEQSCPLESLDPNNDIIPKPSVINVIGSSIGRALQEYPIQIHWYESNINHLHVGFSFDRAQMGNAAAFHRDSKSVIARELNRTWGREGDFFAARSKIHPCLDDASAAHHFLYALTNPVKDGLVEEVSGSPLFSTYHFQAKGKSLRFWYIDWEAYYLAGGARKKKHRIKDYLKWVEWACTPLPKHEKMTVHQRQTWVRKQVREIETAKKKAQRDAGNSFLGKAGLFGLNPRSRPKHPKPSGPDPLCHAATPERVKQYKKEWREFLNRYIQASADYRNGYLHREFPEGSYRPPLVTVYYASSL